MQVRQPLQKKKAKIPNKNGVLAFNQILIYSVFIPFLIYSTT